MSRMKSGSAIIGVVSILILVTMVSLSAEVPKKINYQEDQL
jgi:hypothetical protein